MTVNHANTDASEMLRRRLELCGRVQGVGFRPFVYRLAVELSLTGWVGNDPGGVFIEIQGQSRQLDEFGRRLGDELPPLASISAVQVTDQPAQPGETVFRIESSVPGGHQEVWIAPDIATCDDCRRELFNPDDRRYRYPFINCTNCGPRYSIIKAVPYDRPNTTMSEFRMCPDCQAEYENPADRRFHAQPNACPVCGPKVWLTDTGGQEVPGDPIACTAERLNVGQIVAIKGLGGFHLACRADSEKAVGELRQRKGREAKPFALMVANLDAARALAVIDAQSADLLHAPSRPIVLVPRREDAAIASAVAPDTDTFGLMLPYTPLHELLFAEGVGPLVMTSGNPSEEPLSCENEEARTRLGKIADAFLLHNRPIERRVDDSVVLADRGRLMPLRRARSFVPEPIQLQQPTSKPILAVGGELKSTVCLLVGRDAVLSEHLGELSNPAAYRHFVSTIEQFKKLLRVKPGAVACDLHPQYASTRYAQGLGLPVVPVQHHHAHVAACMAENDLDGRVIGISCDGTGYGTDGAIWGGEIMVADRAEFQRAAHIRYFPLFGGDAAARETWRPAAGVLWLALGEEWRRESADLWTHVDPDALAMCESRLADGARLALTSSLGRLFDAVAFLLGICARNRYEAEAAIRLEAQARRSAGVEPLPYRIIESSGGPEPMRLDVVPIIHSLLERKRQGESPRRLARAFHDTMAAMPAEAAIRVAEQAKVARVVLTGGCMANRLLVEGLESRLVTAGLETFVHQQTPAGDGCVSLGQAVVAAERLKNHTA